MSSFINIILNTINVIIAIIIREILYNFFIKSLQFTANLLITKLRVSSSIIQIQFGGIPLRGGTKQFEN